MHIAVIFLMACAAQLAQASIVPFTSNARDGEDLQALCQNKTINLSRLSHLGALVAKLDADLGGECPKNTAAALRDLKAVVEQSRQRECSMEAYELYRQFYLSYLDTSDKEKRRAQKVLNLPRSLGNFALAYGVQLSGLCRLNMVKELLDAGQKAVAPEDFDHLKKVIDAKGPIATAIGFTSDKPDEMILPSDFAAITRNNNGQQEKISIKLKTNAFIRNVQALCERRFKPVYEPLMIPVARLANLGFDHRKSMLKQEVREAHKNNATNDIIGKWARVVFMCELVGEIELVEEEEDREQSEVNDATMVRVRARDTNEKDGGAPTGRNVLEEAEVDLADLEQVVFEPNLAVELPDEILGTYGQRRAVAGVSTNMDENTRVRSRMVKKVIRRLVKDMNRHRFNKVFGLLTKEMKDNIRLLVSKNGQNLGKDNANDSDIQTAIVTYMNKMVDGQLNPDRAVGLHDGFKIAIALVVLLVLVAAIVLLLTVAG